MRRVTRRGTVLVLLAVVALLGSTAVALAASRQFGYHKVRKRTPERFAEDDRDEHGPEGRQTDSAAVLGVHQCRGIAAAVVAGSARRDTELRGDDVRFRCPDRQWILALGCLGHPGRNDVAAHRRDVASGVSERRERQRHARLHRALPAGGRSDASLPHHSCRGVRAESRSGRDYSCSSRRLRSPGSRPSRLANSSQPLSSDSHRGLIGGRGSERTDGVRAVSRWSSRRSGVHVSEVVLE